MPISRAKKETKVDLAKQGATVMPVNGEFAVQDGKITGRQKQ